MWVSAFRKRRFAPSALIILLILSSEPTLAGRRGRVKYGRAVFLQSTSLVFRGNTCVYFWGFMTSEDFFDGLERNGSPKGPVFHKGPQRVRNFPARVFIDIHSEVRDCRTKPDEDVLPPPPPGFLGSLHFEVNRISCLRTAPLQIGPIERSEVGHQDPASVSYRFAVRTEGVPLTDSLIVLVLSKGGERVEEFHIRL